MTSLKHDLALLSIRLITGAAFLFHGSQKLFGLFGGYGIEGTAGWMESLGIPFPVASTIAAGSAELIGGAALVTGFGQRLLAAPLAFTMLVAAFTAHAGAFDASAGGMEYPLTLAVVVAALGLLGPGRLALGRSTTEIAPTAEPLALRS